MLYDLILKNGTLVTPAESLKADIAVKDGKIALLGNFDSSISAREVYDAEGKHVLPGLIDAHVHFREPGLEEKEDFETGGAAAAFGGVTMVADMPNVLPPTSTAERFAEKARLAREKSRVDFGLFALLSNDNASEIAGLINAGALGFKVFLGTSTGDIAAPSAGVLLDQMREIAAADIRIGFHAENSEINAHFTSLCMKNTDMAAPLLLSMARPSISEALAIQTAISFARETGAAIHIHHITSKDGARLVAKAKRKNVKISGETCPHYLLLDSSGEAAVKVYPPIRDGSCRDALWEALKNGTIDMIASDHAPHAEAEKKLPLWEAPAGLIGVETAARLMLNEVNRGALTINDYARIASEAPAKIWGVYPQKGNTLPGADADFTIVDMEKKGVIQNGELHSKNKNSVFDGTETRGSVEATVVRGRFVMKDGKLAGGKGTGRLVSPARATN
jgi:dihydroorotase